MNRILILLLVLISLLIGACSIQKKANFAGGLPAGDVHLFAASEDADVLQGVLLSELATGKYDVDIKRKSAAVMEVPVVKQYNYSTADTMPVADTAEVKLKVHPFVIAGLGLTSAAVVAGVLAFTGPMLPVWISLLLLGGGLTFVTLGIKKIKQNPTVYKGEKLATSVYWAMIPIGLFLMLLPIYLLFEF
ncbi:MAG: hypothetical protein ACK4IY_02385 [Chitinophagales bacterium]